MATWIFARRSIALMVGATAIGANIEATQAQESRGLPFDVVVTPRFQSLYAKQYLDDFERLDYYGGTIAVEPKNSSWGFVGSYITGEGELTSGTLERDDYFFHVNYTPSGSNLSLIAGVRQLDTFANNPGNGTYDSSIRVLEFGARVGSTFGETSRHAVSAQFTAGFGQTEFEERLVGDPPATYQEFGAVGEASLAYNFFLSHQVALGARFRMLAIVQDVPQDVSGSADDVQTAAGPEFSLSYRF